MGKIIAICNQKGGTGKTTTCISLGGFSALSGRKSLIIDVDPQANATTGLGLEKEKIKTSIYNIILNQTPAEEAILPMQTPNLYLLPSSLGLAGAEVELVGVPRREFRLKEAIFPIKEHFQRIFIDCPPSLGLLTINALSAADSILIPLQCEYYALEGLTRLLSTVELVRENLNPQLEIEGAVLTMADFRTKLTSEVIEEVRKFLREKVYRTVIPRNVRLSEAPGFGKPIFLYDKNSLGAKRYWELSKEILGIEADSVSPPQADSLKEESNGEKGLGQGVGGFNSQEGS